MSRKEDLLQRKADAERMIADGKSLDDYQAYLPNADEDEELSFHYFMRDTILEFKKLRKQKGITQDDVAKKMGTQQTAISRFENYNGVPSLLFLHNYARAMGENLNGISCSGGLNLSIPKEIYALAVQVYGNDPEMVKNSMLETIYREANSRFVYKKEMLEEFSSSETCGSAEWSKGDVLVGVNS